MANINRVIVSGNLTRDAELRRTQSGNEILSWGMAVNDRRRNAQTGEWEDYANFLDVVLFGNRAGSLSGIMRKGMKVTVEGKLRWTQWERDGQKRSKVEIVADEVELPPRGAQDGQQAAQRPQAGGYAYGGGNAPQTPPQQPRGGYQVDYSQPANTAVYDEDIPF